MSPQLHQEQLIGQVERAMDSLRSRCGFRRFVAIGLCSGAFWAFHAAIRNPGIRGAVLLNPRIFFWDPEIERRRAVLHGIKGLTQPGGLVARRSPADFRPRTSSKPHIKLLAPLKRV